MRLVSARGVRCRRVGNGPKAPGATLWSVLAHAAAPPPRGWKRWCRSLRSVFAPAAGSYALGETRLEGGPEAGIEAGIEAGTIFSY